MFEVSESKFKPVQWKTTAHLGTMEVSKVVVDTVQGAIKVGLLQPEDEIVSVFYTRLERGYPTPTLLRDAALEQQIHFCWKTTSTAGADLHVEIRGCKSRSFIFAGVEAVERILQSAEEMTVYHPEIVNTREKKGDGLSIIKKKAEHGLGFSLPPPFRYPDFFFETRLVIK